ncbi:MAG TPA: ferredoxin [Desulfotomaculum sp.]|nr:MAG: hypothetical protein XD84_1662 [Desulfotomaculum sp. 46_80]HAG10300.1 ferredoxin [Desulfotomaculum sp.]HBY03019.1 ferredoxin [Desulfotomaculum sp.]
MTMAGKPPLLKELAVEWNGAGRCSLLKLLCEAELEPQSSCGGEGKCGKCKVRIISGDCSLPGEDELTRLTAEEIENNIRLACRCSVKGKVVLRREQNEQRPRVLEDSISTFFQLEPFLRKQKVTILRDCGQDSLLEQISGQTGAVISEKTLLQAITSLGEYRQDSLTAIIKEGSILGFEPASDAAGDCCGLAVDIGTTTIVAGLLDLKNGKELAVASAVNPQKKYGLDVLSRIECVQNDPSALKLLNTLIMSCLNELIGELCHKAGLNPLQIYEITVAANTVMLHLFLGVNPRSLGRFPYRTVFRKGVTVGAKELGLEVSTFAQVYCMPSVSSFIGADIIAGIISTGLDRSIKKELFLDIGTNGEIVLNKDGKLLACSAAAGPALEGMNISCGMIAAEGAVEEVCLRDSVDFRTIGNFPPRGLCGSGLLTLMAELLDAGVILPSGRMVAREEYERAHPGSFLAALIDHSKKEKRFWLVPPGIGVGSGLYISQADIRQVQLAKGAIVTGVKTLLSRSGLREEDIEKVFLAGAFGNYIHPRYLVRLGFFPDLWLDRICLAGNSSKAGAVMALLSCNIRRRTEELNCKVDYFELSRDSNFEKLFVENMSFACF